MTGGRWVFDVKRDAKGAVTRHKPRYIAQGFTQRMGIDYTDVWAPCPARATVRAVLSLVATQDLKMHVEDIKTAYLNVKPQSRCALPPLPPPPSPWRPLACP